MKVATTYENGEIFQHFGRTPQFKVYEITDGNIISSEVIDTNGTGHGALAGFLMNLGAEVLICGGIGGGAQMAMSEAGIRLYAGASGDADEVVKAFIDGSLPEIGEATCDHHDHHEGHAYSWTVANSIYVDKDYRRQGIGTLMYAELEKRLKDLGIVNMLAGSAFCETEDEYLSHNSYEFHKHMGYEKVAQLKGIGKKFDRWYDLLWMQKKL